MITLLTTTSLLVARDVGNRALDRLGVEIRQARRESLLRLLASSLSTLPSFCSTIGVMTMLFAPSSFICSRISCSAPLPMASIAITDATPNRMPSDVRPARSLLCATASAAVPPLNRTCANMARARDGLDAPVGMATAAMAQPFGFTGVAPAGAADFASGAGVFAFGAAGGFAPGSVTLFAVSAVGVGATIGLRPGMISVLMPALSAGAVSRT